MIYGILLVGLSVVKPILALFIVVCTFANSAAATFSSKGIIPLEVLDSLPKVFLIGQFSEQYEKLNSSTTSLLEVCNNDVYLAYDKWLHTMTELENVSDQLGFSLKGVQLWCSINWNADGSIGHFAYYPKPGSKAVDKVVFGQVVETMMSYYRLPIASTIAFYNYGSVAFPVPGKKQVASKK